jgi:hypothetical protein
MTVPGHGLESSMGKAQRWFGFELTSSPFAAYTNANAPVITVVKNSGVILNAEDANATPDSLTMPLEFIIDEEVFDFPEETPEEEDAKIADGVQALDPREYQLELLEKAKKENIIAVLDTGSGKTLIAVMLMKEMEMIEKAERETRKKVSMFDQQFSVHPFITKQSLVTD